MHIDKNTEGLNASDIELVIEGQTLNSRYYLLNQAFDKRECLLPCLCETPNEYKLSQSDPNFTFDKPIGTIIEDSPCVARTFCLCNRPFVQKLKLPDNKQFQMVRGCRQSMIYCSCCLECLPMINNEFRIRQVDGKELGSLVIGRGICFLGKHFKLPDARIQIFSNEKLLFTIEGSCCQKGVICPFLRCSFKNIEYIIYDHQDLKVGKVFNIYNGCFLECCTRTSKFGIEMPMKAQTYEKILIFFAALYLDYHRYETPYCCLGVR